MLGCISGLGFILWYGAELERVRDVMNIVEVFNIQEKSRICEDILRSLPDWFGIESSILEYIKDVQTMTFWVAAGPEPIGFIAVAKHNKYTAEVHVMGVAPGFHGQKIGSKLLQTAEKSPISQGFKFLTVKTISESKPHEHYDKTRSFYLAFGFLPLEEFKTLWGEHNPCLMLVKTLT